MSMADRVAAVLAAHGDDMTLKRSGETDLALRGKAVRATSPGVTGADVHQTFPVRIGVTELLASDWDVKEPKRGDVIVIDGKSRVVRDVHPLKHGEETAQFYLDVAG